MPTETRPQRTALAKDLVWPQVNYHPHSGQRKIHRSRARHRCASCGRRFGKSKAGGNELVPRALRVYSILDEIRAGNIQRYRDWIVGPNYDDGEREFRVFYDACKMLELPFDKPGTYYDAKGGNMQVSLWDGAYMLEVRSSAHEDSLDGEGLNFVIMAEAAKMKEKIWHKYIRPALADKRGGSLWNTTPEGKNWFYGMWKQGIGGIDPDWESFRMPTWVNDKMFPGGRTDPEILSMAKDMSSERFKQEIAASFTDFVGRVFKDFDYETHVKDITYDPRYPLYAACDYGWTHPFVWLLIQVDVWDNVYVLDEYRVTGKDTTEIAKELKTWRNGASLNVKTFYPDPAEPDDTNILKRELKLQAMVNTGGLIKHRLELMRNHMKLVPEHVPWEEREPKLIISPRCPGLIDEMEEWKYPDKKDDDEYGPENPEDKDNHGPEALGRFFKGYYGQPTSEPGGRERARVRKAKVGRAA